MPPLSSRAPLASPSASDDAASSTPGRRSPNALAAEQTARPTPTGAARVDALAEASAVVERVRLPLVEERVRIAKRSRQTGVVRLRQRTQTRTETVTLDHARHEVELERVAVNEPATVPRAPYHEGDVLVIPLYEERVVLQRQLVLREIVRVRTARTVTPEEVQVVLRSNALDLERVVLGEDGQPQPARALPLPLPVAASTFAPSGAAPVAAPVLGTAPGTAPSDPALPSFARPASPG